MQELEKAHARATQQAVPPKCGAEQEPRRLRPPPQQQRQEQNPCRGESTEALERRRNDGLVSSGQIVAVAGSSAACLRERQKGIPLWR